MWNRSSRSSPRGPFACELRRCESTHGMISRATCRRLCFAGVLSIACACTVLRPIQPPPDDGFPFTGVAAENPAPSESAVGGESYCAKPVVANAGMDESAGGLKSMMARVDVRRRALVCRTADSTNGKGMYNALVWPLAVGALADQALHAPTKSLIFPTAASSFRELWKGSQP